MAAVGGRAVAGPILEVTASANGTGNSTLGTLDLATGQFTQVSTLSAAITGLTTGADGTVYGASANGFLYTISGGASTRFGTLSGPVYYGLAYAGASGFYAANVNTNSLELVSPNGNAATTVGALSPFIAGSGALVFGPAGTLYFTGFDPSGTSALFRVNTATGATTEIGSGLGTFANDPLTLVNVGGTLYGIDTGQASGSGPINIYTINTTTGVATATGVTVSGLAAGFTLDTAVAVPEPTSLAMCGIAAVVGLVVSRRRSQS